MKNDVFDLKELTIKEKMEINGGIGSRFFFLLVEAVISDWDNFKNGLMGRPEVPNN